MAQNQATFTFKIDGVEKAYSSLNQIKDELKQVKDSLSKATNPADVAKFSGQVGALTTAMKAFQLQSKANAFSTNELASNILHAKESIVDAQIAARKALFPPGSIEHIKASIDELNEVMREVSPASDEFITAKKKIEQLTIAQTELQKTAFQQREEYVKLGQSIIGTFGNSLAALQAFSGGNKEYAEVLVKVQQIQTLVAAAQEALGLAQQIRTKAIAANTVATITNTAAQEANNASGKVGITTLSKIGGIWGIVAAAVIGAGVAVYAYVNRLTTAQKTQKEFSEKLTESANSIGQEEAELTVAIDKIEKYSIGSKKRKDAVQEIIDKYPGYISKLAQEKALMGDLKLITDQATEAIIRQGKEKAAQELLGDKLKEQVEIETKLLQIAQERGVSLETLKSQFSDIAANENAVQRGLTNIEALLPSVFGTAGAVVDLLQDQNKLNTELASSTKILEDVLNANNRYKKSNGDAAQTTQQLAAASEAYNAALEARIRLLQAQAEAEQLAADEASNADAQRLQDLQDHLNLQLKIIDVEYEKERAAAKGNRTLLAAAQLESDNKRLNATKAFEDAQFGIRKVANDRAIALENTRSQLFIDRSNRIADDNTRSIAVRQQALRDASNEELSILNRAEAQQLNQADLNETQIQTIREDFSRQRENLVAQTLQKIDTLEVNAKVSLQTKEEQDAKIAEQLQKERIARIFDYTQQGLQAIQQIGNSIFEIQKNKLDAQLQDIDAQFTKIDAQKQQLDSDLQSVDQRIQDLNSQLSTSKQADSNKIISNIERERQAEKKLQDQLNVKAQAENNLSNKKRQLQKEEAENSKELATFNALVSGAQLIISGFLTEPFIPAGLIAGGLASGIVAAQIAAIESAPIPQFADGGYTANGSKYEPAGIVHKGEYVVPQWMVSSPVYSNKVSELESIRQTGYSVGGGVSTTIAAPQPDMAPLFAQLADAIINQPPPIVSVYDIQLETNKVKVAQQRASLK